MISKLKIDINSDIKDVKKVFNEFSDEFKEDPDILVETSSCKKYEFIYIFMDYVRANFFINLLLNNNITIISKNEFSDEFRNIIIENKVNEFKSRIIDDTNFDKILKGFYQENIDKDDILDKISKFGLESLNETEKSILY
jgi:hypothetical protein